MRSPTVPDLEARIALLMSLDEWAEAETLADRLERADRDRQRTVTLAGSALWYAAQGIPVFPLQPGSKIPATRHGLDDGTTDPDRIREWWTKVPDANIGLCCGHRFDVIDIDGPEGARSWCNLDDLPPTIGAVSTPRPGGTHLYIEPVGLRNSTSQIAPGIDTRGRGGYVVAPPSMLIAGRPSVKIAGTYTWRAPLNLPSEGQ